MMGIFIFIFIFLILKEISTKKCCLKHVSKVKTTSLTSPPNLLVNKNIIECFSLETNNMSNLNWKKRKKIQS